MAAVDKSIYEKFTIESSDGKRRTVDIRQGVVGFTYFENILAPSVTATVVVVILVALLKMKKEIDKVFTMVYH